MTCPHGMKFTSLAKSGYRCPLAMASTDTIDCIGIPSGSGVSSLAQASVHSFLSIRHGLPVQERDRIVAEARARGWA